MVKKVKTSKKSRMNRPKKEALDVSQTKEKKSKSKKLQMSFIILLFLCVILLTLMNLLNRMGIRREVENDAWIIAKKPIIYLYPEQTTNVLVKFGKPENLTHTYPKYEDKWQIVAQPNGDLTDDKGRHYYALYWEGQNLNELKAKDGFIVKGVDTIPFLEEKLALLGLTEREANEFIVYWLPELESNEYNFVRFKTKSEIDASMPLSIEPAPDTVIRVMMEFKPANGTEQVMAQNFPLVPERRGFVVVEWGGTRLK